jgi:two-component sensor histidine kinase
MTVSDTSDHAYQRGADSADSGVLAFPIHCDLESVIATAELTRRSPRRSDHAAENHALVALAENLSSPTGILQKLVEVAIALCGAHSAGISLLDEDEQNFYWPAVAGRWSAHVGGRMPRALSPCGTVLDRNAAQLFSRPERYFHCLAATAPLIDEGLLIPFYVGGKAVGTIWIIAHDAGRRFDAEDLRVMTNLAQFASAAYHTLRAREELAAELTDTKLLQALSAQLAHEADTSALYEKIMDAAVKIMRSDFASMQRHYPERGNGGQLRLLAFRGFSPEAAKFWEWVSADSQCTCGVALRTGQRIVESNVETSDFLAGTADQATYLQTGIHAVQSTPLVSRDGKLLGMISTHWRKPHHPSERDLRLLDIVARQAADLIERKQAEETQRLLLAELSHRVKNTLMTVQAIAGQTLRCAKSNSEFVENFNGRLQALARAHSLLTDSSWAGAYLREILRDQLTIENGSDRVTYSGPVVFFPAQTALHLALVLHELGTNARKYGALSVPEGRVDVTWAVLTKGGECAIELSWAERNGPEVRPSGKSGLGSILIERSLESFGGTTSVRFEPSGLRCSIRLPVESATGSNAGLKAAQR